MLVLAVLMGILGGYLLTQMQKSVNLATRMSSVNIPLIDLSGNLLTELVRYRLNESYHIFSQNEQEMAAAERDLANFRNGMQKILEQIQSLIITDTAREILNRYLQEQRIYFQYSQEIMNLSRANKPQEAMKLMRGDSATAYQKLDAITTEFADFQLEWTERSNREDDARAATARAIGIALMVVSLFIALILAYLIVRNTNQQLGKDPGELNAIALRVVHGDYNVDDGSKKQGVYAALVEMVGALKNNIENAQRESVYAREQADKAQTAMQKAEIASQDAQTKTEAMMVAADKLEEMGNALSSATTQLSAQIEQSDRSAAESAQSLSGAATAMNEMNATVREVAKNASIASKASIDTKTKAEAGAEVVGRVVRRMESVHQLSLSMKNDMTRLNDHAQAISQIMSVISDIADQTNLLALNAAIEAARAGEAGRGFAVVADEVRKLAEKTMASTNDVGNAIKAIQESTEKSTQGVDNAVTQIEEATALANQSGSALAEIVANAETTADEVNAIATASEEQSAASEEINRSIIECNDMSRQISDAMNEAAKAVADLADQTQELNALIGQLKQA